MVRFNPFSLGGTYMVHTKSIFLYTSGLHELTEIRNNICYN